MKRQVRQHTHTHTRLRNLRIAAFITGLLTVMCLKAYQSFAGIIPASSFSEMYASMPGSVSIHEAGMASDVSAADPTIDVSGLSRGVYTLKLWQPGAGAYIQKLTFSKL